LVIKRIPQGAFQEQIARKKDKPAKGCAGNLNRQKNLNI
jgi:hypothetical protein